MCLKTLMGSGEGCVTYITRSRESSPSRERRHAEDRIETFQHTTRVPDKKLRCLNIWVLPHEFIYTLNTCDSNALQRFRPKIIF